jgi:hypothetical protein
MTMFDNNEADERPAVTNLEKAAEAELQRALAAAARNLADAVYHAKHALDWLTLDKPAGDAALAQDAAKPVGTVPWRYDLMEAAALLESSQRSIAAALNVAPEVK